MQLIQGDCLEVLQTFSDESIDAGVTSPPYYNLRQYAQWKTYEAYLADMEFVMQQCARVLKPGRHFAWNVQAKMPDKRDGERWHYPLSADIVRMAYAAGLMLETTLIWHKTNGMAQRMFGSYPFPPSIMYTCDIEDIHIFRRPGKAEYIKTEDSKLTLDEWKEWTTHIWHMPMPTEKIGHNATFPFELPYRFIRLHTLVGDTVLDPFAGSGTTGIACAKTGRKFIGIERDATYYDLARRRIAAAESQLPML